MALLPGAVEITGRSRSTMERILGVVANNFTHPTWAVEVLNESTLSDDLEEPVFRDLPLVYAAFGTMALFTAVSFQCKRGSRGLLGLGAVVTVALSVITGYGVCVHAEVPITIMTQVLVRSSFAALWSSTFILTPVPSFSRLCCLGSGWMTPTC